MNIQDIEVEQRVFHRTVNKDYPSTVKGFTGGNVLIQPDNWNGTPDEVHPDTLYPLQEEEEE